MAINSYALSDLVTRIQLTLPSKFDTTDTNTDIYAFWQGICSMLKLDTDLLDELFRQTNLTSASGLYVDQYITSLTKLSRLTLYTISSGSVVGNTTLGVSGTVYNPSTAPIYGISPGQQIYLAGNGIMDSYTVSTGYVAGTNPITLSTPLTANASGYIYIMESDASYKNRYYNDVFIYNCTKAGINQIVIDLTGSAPFAMYATAKRGAYMSGAVGDNIDLNNPGYYYDDPSFFATYGDPSPKAFTAYVQFSARPFGSATDPNFIYLCKTIDSIRAQGITVYLYYPGP